MARIAHKCKCHDRDYTVCPKCDCEYCPDYWPTCPRCAEIARTRPISIPPKPVNHANARLIAKAPEMREALAAAIEVLDAEGIVYGNCDQEPLDVLSNARALLAEIDGNG